MGGAVTLVGAPVGSDYDRGLAGEAKVDVARRLNCAHPSAADLRPAGGAVNGFVVDEDANHIRIITDRDPRQEVLKLVAKRPAEKFN